MVKIWIYLGIAAATVALLLVVDDNGYARGRDAAQKHCAETTVPAAKQAVQKQCDINAKLTEIANAKHDADKDAAIARAERQRDQLRKSKQGGVYSVSVPNTPNVHSERADSVRPSDGRGCNTRDDLIIDLGEKCKQRSDEFLNCRQFLLDERKAVKL